MIKTLQLLDLGHVKICALMNYKDLKIERAINVETTLSFSYPNSDSKNPLIKEECYIRTKENEYIVKEINVSEDYTEYICKVNLENIKGNFVSRFETIRKPCSESVNLALVGTGWLIGSCDVTKLRTVRKNNVSSYDILTEIQNGYDCEMDFDSINKKVHIYQRMGTDKGVYFSEQLNLKKLDIQRDTHEYATRLIMCGKDGLTVTAVNGGLNYVENHQYSPKVITVYWEDNRYTDAQSLLEDGKARLDYLSKPYRSYKAEIIDLARVSSIYKDCLGYGLGDNITLLSSTTNTKEKQRIVKITEFPDSPELNTCELANKIVSLEDLQVRVIESTEVVGSITTSDGYVDGTKINGIDWTQIKNVHLNLVDIQDLSAVTGRIGTLETTVLYTTEFNAKMATIDNAIIKKATIIDLIATNEKVNTLEVNAETVNALLAHNIGANNLQAGAIQAGSEVIGTSAISSAQIISLKVAKLEAGEISTNKFTVKSDNGNLKILGDTVKLWDNAGKERVSLGLNGTDYNLLIRGTDGTTVLFGVEGVTHAGITKGAVDDTNVATGANIDGSKIEKESLIVQINGATTLLKTSRIKYDPTGQTLDVAFNALNNTVTSQGSVITNQATSISALQGQIALKVGQTEISNSIYASKIIPDTRDANQVPSWYFSNYGKQVINEFKNRSAIGVPGSAPYGGLITIVPWGDASGGSITQEFKSAEGVFKRVSISDSAWSAWAQTESTTGAQTKVDILNTNTVQPLITKITTVETSINSANAEITLLKNAITLKVESSTFTSYQTSVSSSLATAQASANTANTNATKAQTTANTANTGLATTNANVTSLTSRLTTTENSISVLQSGILLKASQSSLETTNSNVTTAQNAANTANAGLTTTNANVSGVTNRLSTAEASINLQAGQIALRVDANGVKSIIEQNPNSVLTAFNSTTGKFIIKNGNLEIQAASGRTALSIDTDGYIMNEWGIRTFCPSYGISMDGALLCSGDDHTLLRAYGILYGSSSGRLLNFISRNGVKITYGDGVTLGELTVGIVASNKYRTFIGGVTGIEMSENDISSYSTRLWLNYAGGTSGSPSTTLVGDGMSGGGYGTLHCGSFYSHGSKNALVKTDHYGERAVSAYETAETYFGDIGRGRVINGTCICYLDPIFLETINSNIQYEVFLTKYGEGDIWIDEMNPNYFSVKGSNISFAWEVKAKRKGYENKRLELI